MVKRICSIAAAALLAVLVIMFFTNDFGLVDIHKTSLVLAMGIDKDGDNLQVTAQIAVPRPSQSGDAIEYVEVQGGGPTVADALNEINSKTGVYPKLHFLKIIILGESCQNGDIFSLLDYFYRGEYTDLTPLVAACKGEAGKLLAMPTAASDTASMPIEKVLSDELKKSANVSTVNLKLIAQHRYSQSEYSYMPYIEFNEQGTSESGRGVGGQTPPPDTGEGGDAPAAAQGGEEQKSGGGGGQQEKPVEFTCKKIAIFSAGRFAGILDENSAFAFNLVTNKVNRAVYTFSHEGNSYTVGLRGNINGVSLKIKDGNPVLTLKLISKAELLEITSGSEPKKIAEQAELSKEILTACENSIKGELLSLVDAVTKSGCDIFGARDKLYKKENKYFAAFKDNLLSRMRVEYDVRLRSAV